VPNRTIEANAVNRAASGGHKARRSVLAATFCSKKRAFKTCAHDSGEPETYTTSAVNVGAIKKIAIKTLRHRIGVALMALDRSPE
jgi:hypothetical protein